MADTTEDGRITRLEKEVRVLRDALLHTAQSCIAVVDVVMELNTRLAAVETGHVYIAEGAGSLPSTSGSPLVRHHATISLGANGVAQPGGQSPAR